MKSQTTQITGNRILVGDLTRKTIFMNSQTTEVTGNRTVVGDLIRKKYL